MSLTSDVLIPKAAVLPVHGLSLVPKSTYPRRNSDTTQVQSSRGAEMQLATSRTPIRRVRPPPVQIINATRVSSAQTPPYLQRRNVPNQPQITRAYNVARQQQQQQQAPPVQRVQQQQANTQQQGNTERRASLNGNIVQVQRVRVAPQTSSASDGLYPHLKNQLQAGPTTSMRQSRVSPQRRTQIQIPLADLSRQNDNKGPAVYVIEKSGLMSSLQRTSSQHPQPPIQLQRAQQPHQQSQQRQIVQEHSNRNNQLLSAGSQPNCQPNVEQNPYMALQNPLDIRSDIDNLVSSNDNFGSLPFDIGSNELTDLFLDSDTSEFI